MLYGVCSKVDLISYLQKNYLTQQALLAQANITESELLAYQQNNVMPLCSYKLDITCKSNSFFGVFEEESKTQYYAKGYVSWLETLGSMNDPKQVFSVFSQRYIDAVDQLKRKGFNSSNEKVNSKLNLHIEEEWRHFLQGIYGLCTKSGLPEDIAGKELAILQINEILAQDETLMDLKKLTKAVNLLDSSSSMFAPHERLKSSRHRLINEVRRVYKLTN